MAHGVKRDLVGQRFGRLLVRCNVPVPRDARSRSARWKCDCVCGRETVVEARSLLYGRTQSCGCLHRERASASNSKPDGVASFNRLRETYMNHAKKYGRDWQLSDDVLLSLFQQKCAYCGIPPSRCETKSKLGMMYNGVDRVDNSKGYVPGNVVACCRQCNVAKGQMSEQSFREWIARAYAYLNGGTKF